MKAMRQAFAPLRPIPPLKREHSGWRRRTLGEPRLEDILEDPILHLVMRRDGVTAQDLAAVIHNAQSFLRRRLCLVELQAA